MNDERFSWHECAAWYVLRAHGYLRNVAFLEPGIVRDRYVEEIRRYAYLADQSSDRAAAIERVHGSVFPGVTP